MASVSMIMNKNMLKSFMRNNLRSLVTNSNLRNCSPTENNSDLKVSSFGAGTTGKFFERDPAPYFFNSKVQDILQSLTGFDLKKIFRRKHMKPKNPEYRFVSDSELQTMLKDTEKRAKEKLQMPPILQTREPINRILSVNPELKRFENSKLIFTDISVGTTDRNRVIVVRDQEGILREASWEERERMNQMFFPKPGKELDIPKMFLGEHLEHLLEAEDQKYEFILDRACIQFEPDDAIYIQVISKVYEHIDKTHQFQILHSTRHFGPMTFYLVFQNKMDNLLVFMIRQERIDDACSLIKLYQILHPGSKTSQINVDTLDKIALIKAYAKEDSLKSSSIELALQSYLEIERERKQLQEGIERAHGFSK